MRGDRLGFAAVFSAVAPPPHQHRRSHSETTLNLWNRKPTAQGAKSESPLKKWPGLWKRSVNRGIGNFKLDFSNYHSEIALKENWQECGGKRHFHKRVSLLTAKQSLSQAREGADFTKTPVFLEVIEICLYLLALGTQKMMGVFMIHHQIRGALVLSSTENASQQIQPVFILENKSRSALRFSVQRRGAAPLFHPSEQRECVQVKDVPQITQHFGQPTQCHHHHILLLHLQHTQKAVKLWIPLSRHQVPKPTHLTLTNLCVKQGL